MLGMMVVIMVLDRLPSDIDQITVIKSLNGFEDAASRYALAAVNVPYHMSP